MLLQLYTHDERLNQQKIPLPNIASTVCTNLTQLPTIDDTMDQFKTKEKFVNTPIT